MPLRQFLLGLTGILLLLLLVRIPMFLNAGDRSAELLGNTVGMVVAGVFWSYIIWWIMQRVTKGERGDPKRFVLILTAIICGFMLILQAFRH